MIITRNLQRAVLISALAIICLGGVAAGDEFASNWPEKTQRVWAGPEYWANRLQDWQINDGRLECVEGSAELPMRTVHLLTHPLRNQQGTLTMHVRLGAINPNGQPHENTWAGFLIGIGGDHVDYRTSALAHHWPAEDGGLIAAVDGSGKVVFRDNTFQIFLQDDTVTGSTKARGPLGVDQWPELSGVESSRPSAGAEDRLPADVDLRLEAQPNGTVYSLTLSAHDHATGKLISRATVDNVASAYLTGNMALVSHSSPQKAGPGYWFRDWRASGSKLVHHPERGLGPVIMTQYTLSRGTLKLTAQMGPLGPQDTPAAELQVRRGLLDHWKTVATASLLHPSATFTFFTGNWDASRDTRYRVAYDLRTGPGQTKTHYYEGTIRKEPTDQDNIVVAAFTGHKIFTGGQLRWNGNSIWFPHNELVAAVAYHNPDFLFFSGDQVYEGDLTDAQREPLDKAILDYLYKWYRWCWAFRDLTRERPSVSIPDDHDVYHGNLWGAGGKKTVQEGDGKTQQDSGGYKMDPRFVNMVQATQTSHLPDCPDPKPVLQGIGVYFTDIAYAGISFAVIEDRKWKSSPTVAVPEARVRNGFPQNPDFDMAKNGDVPGTHLLGDRQLRFLRDWAADWSHGAQFKVVLSQTTFTCIHTVPKHFTGDDGMTEIPPVPAGTMPPGYKIAIDGDSNGWPQTPRNNALREMRRAFAFHIAGDQHLGSLTHYGVDDWNDASYALCVPSVGNTWPRRWYPPVPGRNREPDAPEYTGEFFDGFGNKITVLAVSNPVISGHEPAALYDRAPGYGIVRLDKTTRQITAECWPRWVDPSEPDAEQYLGWPITVNQLDNYGRKPAAYLPTIIVTGMSNPVIQVIDEDTGDTTYTLRISGTTFRPKVFREGAYTLHIGEKDGPMKKLTGIRPAKSPDETIEVSFQSSQR